MRMPMPNSIAAALLAGLVLLAPAGAANFEPTFTYQGEVKNSGVPMNGTADFVFKLFTAAANGIQVGPTLLLDDVVVTDGIFKVELDFTNGGTIPGVYDGIERWLDIAVNGTQLNPRQELTPTPHALVASQLQFPYAARTTGNPAFTLIQESDGPQTRAMHISSTATDTGSVALIGEMLTETTANGTGVLGISRAGNGFGVIGTNLSPTGNCTGVYGNAESVNGIGVLGLSNHPSGVTRGVNGKVFSPNGHAGYFEGRGYFSGQVGIGIENPDALLHISGPPSPSGLALNAYDNLFVGSGNDFVAVNRFTPITQAEFFGVRAPTTGTNYGGMYMETESATGKPFYGYATNGEAQAWTYYDGSSNAWKLHVGIDRITVPNATGNVGIKRTPTANDLEVEGTASKTLAGSWLANSDARIKTDIATIEKALDTIDRVRLVSFRYNNAYRQAHPKIADQTYLNVTAQEFREVFPDHVKGSGEHLPNGEEILQVDTYPLTIYSAAAVQELHALVRAQQDRIVVKDQEIGELRARLARLESAVAAISAEGEAQFRAASIETER